MSMRQIGRASRRSELANVTSDCRVLPPAEGASQQGAVCDVLGKGGKPTDQEKALHCCALAEDRHLSPGEPRDLGGFSAGCRLFTGSPPAG